VVYRDSGPLSTLRLSSQLRLGGARARWFAYGLVEVSAVFTFDHSFQHELNSAESRIGPGALAGVGVMGLITRVFFLGAELGVNADLQLREGFDELAVASVQWRVVAGVLLGAR
ncbi:MAG: hypothetical protein KC468_00545, partial [Myxococcales bacterium]|nr:hypothetical protein [Myxococcales bacterium]